MVPGWGFGDAFWKPVCERLKEFETHTLDLGFLTANTSVNPPIRTDTLTIAIGHSLGFQWLLGQANFAWNAYVSVNGFTRFSHALDFRSGTPVRVVDAMIDKFSKKPSQVVADFHARCGHKWPPETFNETRLKDGLTWLRDWDLRETFQALDRPGLVLAGATDPIVTPGMTNDCFHAKKGLQMYWHETGGHLLPQSDPDWTAAQIRAFAEPFRADPL